PQGNPSPPFLAQRALGLSGDGCLDDEVRRDGFSLGEKDVERIDAAEGQSQLLGDLVQGDLGGEALMQPPQVDDEPPIDEHPDIVVTGKAENFAADVLELGGCLEGEVEVVLP